MKTTAEIRAESLIQVERGAIRDSKPGDGRRPIRKRGFHRALKRGEFWAKIEQGTRNIMNSLARDMFREIPEPSPFLGMLVSPNQAAEEEK